MDSTEKSFWVSCTRLNGVKSALCFDVQQQNIHEFTEGRVGVYRPIRVLFNTPIIPTGSFKSAGTSDLTWPRLHWWLSFWGAVGAKWRYIRVQHWDFELADFDNEAAKPPLTVNLRGVAFKSRRLLNSPEDIPPCFQHPKIRSLASFAWLIDKTEQVSRWDRM